MSKVYIGYSEYGLEGVDEEFVQFVFDMVIGMAKLDEESEAGLMLTSDDHMQDLNKKFRGKDKPTNILSFAYNETADKDFIPADDKRYLGDIFISRAKLLEEAKAEHISDKARFVELFVHGLLHLAGMTHDTDKDAEKMEELEDKIVAKVLGE